MVDKGVSKFGDLSRDSDSSDGSDEITGAAAGNTKAGKNLNNKKVVNDGAGRQEDPNKSKITRRIDDQLAINNHTLDLSNCKLQNLGDLQKMSGLSELQSINLSKNLLDNIDMLNQMQKLKVITVSDNYIRSVNLQLPKLQELDLRNNFIEKVPILSQMPQLKVLILNANNITELKLQCKKENYNNLMKMVFRNNKIRFTNMEVINFVKKLKEFRALRVLNLENNPFEKDEQIRAKIIRGLPQNLDMYNNQRKIYVQGTISKAAEGEGATAEGPVGGDAGGQGDEENKTAVTVMPTLENLLYNLEAANSHPNRALEFLKQLYVDADRIKQVQDSQSQSVFIQSFTKAKDTHTIKENIETFMQHAQLLVDNHFELRSIILSILSKLTVIRSHDFGVKCFYTLRDLMVAGKELEAQVMEQLNTNVIREMSDRDPKEIPVSILVGLKDLVEKQQSHQTNLMSKLFDVFFPKWLHSIKQQYLRSKGKNSEEDSDQTDAILALLTASLRDDQVNVNKMYETQLHDTVAEIFLRTNPQQSRYIHLIECMNEIAKMHSNAATSYVEKYVHRDVMQEIKLTFYSYKKSQELAPADNKDNVAMIVKMYRVFSAQIDLIASLLNANRKQREIILSEGLIVELLQVLTHSNTDPILLTSICYLAEKVLNAESIKTNPRELADKINRMQSCENLIQYLGMGKYKDLMKNTSKYNNQEDQVAQQDGNEGALEYLNDPLIHKLFIQIVKLIQFFCKELSILVKAEKEAANGRIDDKQRKLKNLFEQVCTRLNNSDREEALFRCLAIPNDDVRLEVVHTLYYVPIDEIDAEEIDQLLKLMSPQNIGAGKTELVLSVIFNILSNLISDTSQKAIETTTLFKTKFSYQAISLALDILTKNQERNVDDAEEESEKFTLSLSILNFLKHASKETKTKDQLKNKGDVLKKILYSEQQYTVDMEFIHTPVEVETTQLGKDFEALKSSISHSSESIEPYNYVSFRVLHQMANLLESSKPKGTYDPCVLGDNAFDFIITAYKENLTYKTNFEKQFWKFDGDDTESKEQMDSEAIKDQKRHHKVFTIKNGIKGILHFLTAQNNGVEQWLRLHSDQAITFAGCIDKHPVFGRGLKYQIKRAQRKEKDKAEILGMAAKKNARKQNKGDAGASAAQPAKNKNAGGSEAAMQQCFQDEELGSGYSITDTELYIAQQKTSAVSVAIRAREMTSMGIQNDELRSLCVAAFLRCLYASIDCAPDGQYHLQAVNNLKSDKIFTSITQLCASTGWLTANIGSKYLQVMRYITRVNTTKRLEDSKNMIKYEILSIVIKRILGLLKAKIKNENNNMELTEDDQNLLCHLAVICNQLVTQCVLFDFKSKTEEYNEIETEDERKQRFVLIDLLISKLFPLEEVQILIDVLFQEMLNAQNRLHGATRDNDQQATGNMTLEHTKKFLTKYLAYCNKYKYDVLQYMMRQMVFVGKNMREGFLEEILEGTNQTQVTLNYSAQMIKDDEKRFEQSDGESCFRSLAYKKKQEIQQWLKFQSKRETQAKVDQEREKLDEVKKDCTLGERILFSQPMNTHVQYATANAANKEYQVFTIVLTNQGVYVIDDNDKSFNLDDEDRNPNGPISSKDNHRYKGPTKMDTFSYSEIKKVSFSKRISQRIVLHIERVVEADPVNEPLYEGMHQAAQRQNVRATPQGGDQSRTPGDDSTPGNGTTAGHPDVAVKRDQRRAPKKVKQSVFVTFVVPNVIDGIQMREIFDGADLQTLSEADDDFEQGADEDLLLNFALLDKIVTHGESISVEKRELCPLCSKNRMERSGEGKKCVCSYHVVYAYRIKEEIALKICKKSKQRGGPARLLNTPMATHTKTVVKSKNKVEQPNLRLGFNQHVGSKPIAKPAFGILLISATDMYFMEEIPGNWRDHTLKSKNDQFGTGLFFPGEESKTRNPQDQSTGDVTAVKGLVKSMDADGKDKIEMRSITKLSVINDRVPTLELHYKQIGSTKTERVWFCMMSDYNLQDTLSTIKQLKKRGGRGGNNYDDDDE